MVKENSHLGRSKGTARYVFEHRTNLIDRNAWKPLDEIVNRRFVFKIFKQGSNRHASSFEHPGSTDDSRIAFDCRAT